MLDKFLKFWGYVLDAWDWFIGLFDLPDKLAAKMSPIVGKLPWQNYDDTTIGLTFFWLVGLYSTFRWVSWIAGEHGKLRPALNVVGMVPAAGTFVKWGLEICVWVVVGGLVFTMMEAGLIPALVVLLITMWFFHRNETNDFFGGVGSLGRSGLNLAGKGLDISAKAVQASTKLAMGNPRAKVYFAAFAELYKQFQEDPKMQVSGMFDLHGFEGALENLRHQFEHEHPNDTDFIEVAFNEFCTAFDVSHGHATRATQVATRLLGAV